MRTYVVGAIILLLSGCSARSGGHPVAATPEIEVLVRRDSGGPPLLSVDTLSYPHQAPWLADFYVRVRFPRDYVLTELEARVGLDVWMGPQMFGGADGELLLETEADARGSWYRSDVVRTGRLSGDYRQEREVIIGPFPLLEVIPGPTDADARLWPTRFRIHVDVFPISPAPESTQRLHQEKIIILR